MAHGYKHVYGLIRNPIGPKIDTVRQQFCRGRFSIDRAYMELMRQLGFKAVCDLDTIRSWGEIKRQQVLSMVRAIRKAGLLRSCNKITHPYWSSLRTSIYNRDLLLGRASTWEHALLIQAWPIIEWTKLAVTSCYTHVWWYGYFLRGVNFMSTIDDIHRLPCGSHVCMCMCIHILFFGRVHYVLLVRFSTTRRINQIKTLISRLNG